jgi:hypothetical protein
MSAFFQAIERLSFVISNDFYDLLVSCPYVAFLEKDFLQVLMFFYNNGFGHHIVDDKFYFT